VVTGLFSEFAEGIVVPVPTGTEQG
jgi:hypothetical protein